MVPHTGILQHALTAGSGSVDLKEYEKKNMVLQQCREKIESVCFDLRLRKVRRDGVLCPPRHHLSQRVQQLACLARDRLCRPSSRTLTPALSASGKGVEEGQKKTRAARGGCTEQGTGR